MERDSEPGECAAALEPAEPDAAPDVEPDGAPNVEPDAASNVEPDAAPNVEPDAAPACRAGAPSALQLQLQRWTPETRRLKPRTPNLKPDPFKYQCGRPKSGA